MKNVSKALVELAHELDPVNNRNITATVSQIICHNTHQWRRRVCKNADKPSIITRIARVNKAQAPNTKYSIIAPLYEDWRSPMERTMFHSTSESSTSMYIVSKIKMTGVL